MRKILLVPGLLIAASISGPAFAQSALLLPGLQPVVDFFGGMQGWQSRGDIDQAQQQLGQSVQVAAEQPQTLSAGGADVWLGQSVAGNGLQGTMQGPLQGTMAGASVQGGLQTPLQSGLQTPLQGALGGVTQGLGGIR